MRRTATSDWDQAAARLWAAGRQSDASDMVAAALAGQDPPPAEGVLQLSRYLFHQFRFDEAAAVLDSARQHYPDHPGVLGSYGSALIRARRHSEALPIFETLLRRGIINADVHDALACCYGVAGNLVKARLHGTQALKAKEKVASAGAAPAELNLAVSPEGKAKVIAFTLFGSRPRYLRGAIQNLLAARVHYPGWACRYYVDDSVDATFRKVIADEGAELVEDNGPADRRHLLARRFLVADDPAVGRYLVRDCDSVVSAREAAAVQAWIESGRPFHVMRDWYTHTGLMMAGMWGGIAGVLPDMAGRLGSFAARQPDHSTWDQHFLREEIWPHIRDHALIHDRFFTAHGSRPFPTPDPPLSDHVGQNEYAAAARAQSREVAELAKRIPALGIRSAPVKLTMRMAVRPS